MGVATRTAVSPDGRTWRLKKVREKVSFAEARQEPTFWSSVVITALLVGLIVRMLVVDPAAPVMLAFVLPVAILWLIERSTYLLRPRIEAETEGPPPERVVWKTGHMFGSDKSMSRAVEAIETGQAVSSPHGLRLEQWDSGGKSATG